MDAAEFAPPRCPKRSCPMHEQPAGRFWYRDGHYVARCHPAPVPRYVCKICDGKFSAQTFRHSYRDRRPDANDPLFRMLTSGVGLRQSGRNLCLDICSVVHKMRKIARTCALLHELMASKLTASTYLLDEEESYETASIRPLTMPVLIEKDTWFVVATAVGSIRRLAREGSRRRALQDAEEAARGERRDESAEVVRQVLEQLRGKVGDRPVTLRTDEKSSYATIAKAVFGERLVHETTPGRAPRTTRNPLFAINTTMAMTRDNCGRLRRRSWLVSKQGSALAAHLHVFTVYRNYVRRRFNYDEPSASSATFLGILPRVLETAEVLRWRQDWGDLSSHPTSRDGQTNYRQFAAARAADTTPSLTL